MFLEDGEGDVLFLEDILAADDESKILNFVGVTPGDFMIFDRLEVGAAGVFGGFDRPFDEGVAGDEGDVVEVDDLGEGLVD